MADNTASTVGPATSGVLISQERAPMPMLKKLHPEAATASCDCFYADGPLHDALVGIEDADPLTAALLITVLVSNEEEDFYLRIPPIKERYLENGSNWDPDDFHRFATEHNWRDPVRVSLLFGLASFAREAQYHPRSVLGA